MSNNPERKRRRAERKKQSGRAVFISAEAQLAMLHKVLQEPQCQAMLDEMFDEMDTEMETVLLEMEKEIAEIDDLYPNLEQQ
jgi:hypothetical protein